VVSMHCHAPSCRPCQHSCSCLCLDEVTH
jgi:hypothetical protein